MNRLDLTNTAAAIKVYDSTQTERDAMLDRAESNTDVSAWEKAEKEAADKVRRAFYEDSKDRNNLDHCLIVDLGWLREIVAIQEGLRHEP